MSTNGQAEVLIVDDQPYSSGGSILEEEVNENNYNKEEEKEVLVEEAKENTKPSKPSEPIFVPVITGTATIESNFAYSDKNGENSQKEQDIEGDVKKKSKCCLLV